MGNAGIIYDGQTIDFGAHGVSGFQPGRSADLHRSFGGTAQTVVEQAYERLAIEKHWGKDDAGPDTGTALYRALMSFWNTWGIHGHPFAFSHDLSKTFGSVITGDPVLGNRLINGDLEAWTSDTEPEDVTIVLNGSTAIAREGQEENVFEGLYALRWDIAGGAQSEAEFLSDRAIPSGAAFQVAFRQRHSSSGQKLQYAIQNQANSKWAQNTTGSWGTTKVWLDATTVTGFDWALFSQDFASGPDATGILKLAVRNPTSPASSWIDDLRLARIAPATLTVRNRTGLAAGDAIRIISRTEPREEIAVVSSFTTPADLSSALTLSALPRGRFEARDIVRWVDYYPFLVAEQDDAAAVWEEEASTYRLKLKCRDALTGRV